jgi:hypothetical protein
MFVVCSCTLRIKSLALAREVFCDQHFNRSIRGVVKLLRRGKQGVVAALQFRAIIGSEFAAYDA